MPLYRAYDIACHICHTYVICIYVMYVMYVMYVIYHNICQVKCHVWHKDTHLSYVAYDVQGMRYMACHIWQLWHI